MSHDKGVNEDRYIIFNPVKITIKKKLDEVVPQRVLEKEANNKEDVPIDNNTSASTPTSSPNLELEENIITTKNRQEDVPLNSSSDDNLVISSDLLNIQEDIIGNVNNNKNKNNIPHVQNGGTTNNNKKKKKNRKKNG